MFVSYNLPSDFNEDGEILILEQELLHIMESKFGSSKSSNNNRNATSSAVNS